MAHSACVFAGAGRYLLAAAVGLKLADATRRICLYARPHADHSRLFFAVARGVFPIHEVPAVE